jgi:putative redox protein
MSMTARSRSADGGLRQEVDVNGRHTIQTDEPERLGGSDLAPAPHELLAAALASCVSTMVAAYATSRGWSTEGICAEVEYDPDSQPRRVDVRLVLPAGIEEERRRRLERVARSCPVRRALESDFAFGEETVLEQPRAAAA